MKKLLIIAVSVCTMLAGCTIDERDGGMKNDSRNLITFTTPVTGAVTRSGENPEYGPVDGQKYPENEYFHVFAVRTDADYLGSEDWASASLYMDVDVSKKEVDGKKYWAPAEDYYWPQNGKLTFAAYSPAKMIPAPAGISYNGTGLKIENFQTPAVGEQYDVMYAPRVFNKAAVDRPLDTGTPNPYYGVDIMFKHALSQIKFTVKSDKAYTNMKLKEITIKTITDKGTFNENITTGVASYSANPAWTAGTSTADYTPFKNDDGVVVTATSAEVGTPLLMIPQTLPANSEITVKWTYRNGGVATDIEDEITLDFDALIVTWEMGKRYTYNITIALDKIYFNPTVESWDACADISIDMRNQTFTVGEGENAVSFEMVYVEGGTFLMGSQSTDPDGQNYDSEAVSDESPVHQVTLTQDYWMGKYEVTQGLWEAVMGTTWPGTAPSDTYGKGADYPAYDVSWNDICGTGGFLDKLNTALAAELGGKHFALPTEAQWEFAAAGGKAGYNTDGTRIHTYSGSNTVNDVAWYRDNSDGQTHPVGQKQPNELGIYDMSGNIYEFCADWYGTYGAGPDTDPTGPAISPDCVPRGGSWDYYVEYCTVSHRQTIDPFNRGYYGSFGFRLALLP